jgi:hypothetical protein
MVIALLPYGKPEKHRALLVGQPIESAMLFEGTNAGKKVLGDLTATDHLIIVASSRALTASLHGLNCRVSLLLQEPVAIKPRFHTFCRFFSGRYHRVLTHSTALLSKLSNGRFTVHGGSFLLTPKVSDPPKQKRISLIASSKNSTIGHRLRHRIAAWSKQASPDLNLFGTGYHRVEDKRDAHDDYYFSVCIENSRTPGYFTEKLIDSFLCRSLPIYWGAPDIAHFFDPRGMICCSCESELRDITQRVTEADYHLRMPYLEENIRRATAFSDFYTNAVRVLKHEDDVRLP